MTPQLDLLKCESEDSTIAQAIAEVAAAETKNLQTVSDTICEISKRLNTLREDGDKDSRDYADVQVKKATDAVEALAKKLDDFKQSPEVDTSKLLDEAKQDAANQIKEAIGNLGVDIAQLKALADLLDQTDELKTLAKIQTQLNDQAKEIAALRDEVANAPTEQDIVCIQVASLRRLAEAINAAADGFQAGTMQCVFGADKSANLPA